MYYIIVFDALQAGIHHDSVNGAPKNYICRPCINQTAGTDAKMNENAFNELH